MTIPRPTPSHHITPSQALHAYVEGHITEQQYLAQLAPWCGQRQYAETPRRASAMCVLYCVMYPTKQVRQYD